MTLHILVRMMKSPDFPN